MVGNMTSMLRDVCEYATLWTHRQCDTFGKLGLTIHSRPADWRVAYATHVQLMQRPSHSNGAGEASASFSVATWNVHGGEDAHGKPALAEQMRVLQHLSAVVVCLQEVPTSMLNMLTERYEIVSLVPVYSVVDPRVATPAASSAAAASARASSRVQKHFDWELLAATPGAPGVQQCLFNVIAVDCRSGIVSSGDEVVTLEQYEVTGHGPLRVHERRALSCVTLTSSGGSSALAAAPLFVFHTHLHDEHGDAGDAKRYKQVTALCEHLTQLRKRSPYARFILCGDLNACSKHDYTPAEQLCLYAFSGGLISEHHNYWGALERLETLAVDSFELAAQPRPKISCWACRRVDHILFSRPTGHCNWTVQHSAVHYTQASDHLPIVCWITA
jgi:endonuclease/exonuclease/phosphatase family metal-dependent hydrolase